MKISTLNSGITKGTEIVSGVILLEDPVRRTDLGPNSFACLANVRGSVCVIEIVKIKSSLPNQKEVL